MDRYGMQGIGFMVLLSFSVLMLVNQHAPFDWWTSSSSVSVPSSQVLRSYGMKDLHQTLGGEETRRQLLQVVSPAPAPGPSSSSGQTYISYGALSAGYVPCPPQTGRSYYTANCQSASGPVNPYTRGCSVISLCARG